MTDLVVHPVAGLGEVTGGDDLVALLDGTDLADGDVVVVTSKVVSKAEGRVRRLTREEALAEEAVRLVARRGPTSIVRTRHGLVMAAAGVDASNVAAGHVVLLPLDPDASARALRRGLRERRGVDVAVVVTDTAGRAWRTGQTDIAVGAAGLVVLDDHAGRTDPYGNPLAVTAPAVADEVAAAAELATGKLAQAPVCRVRGLARFVLPADDDGPGARALVREEATDMFGLGAREAVLEALALALDPEAPAHPGLGAPADAATVHDALVALLPGYRVRPEGERVVVDLGGTDGREQGRAEVVLAAVAAAHGWRVVASGVVGRPEAVEPGGAGGSPAP